MIRPQDFPLFFAAVTKLFVQDPDFYRLFRRQGFTAKEWPECDAKPFAVTFEALAFEKTVEAAKVTMRSKLKGLGDYPLPHAYEELWALYGEMRAYGIWSQAARIIMNDPMRGPEVVANIRQPANLEAILVQNELTQHLEKKIKAAQAGEQSAVIVPSWEKLSKGIGGFNPGRVFLFVAGTGVGKTTFALNLLSKAITAPEFPVLLVNMEMTVPDMLDRVVAIGTGSSPQWAERFYKAELDHVSEFAGKLMSQSPYYITDGRTLTIDEITGQITRYVDESGVKLVVIDYDQKIRTRQHGEEWQVIQKAVEAIEEIAKNTNTAIIVLAQGDENGDPKASKRSMQPCSAVLSMFREGKDYFIETKKNRYGRRFKLSLKTNFEKYQIEEGDYVDESIPAPATDLHSKLFGQGQPSRSAPKTFPR